MGCPTQGVVLVSLCVRERTSGSAVSLEDSLRQVLNSLDRCSTRTNRRRMHTLGWKVAVTSLSILIVYCVADHFWLTPRIAYVNTARLMVGFSEAAKVETELKAEDAKWKERLKQLQDTLQASIDNMSKEYDQASAARKRELQDLLSARNQQVNNFKTANQATIEKLRQEKMKSAIEKINVYLAEYGKEHRYTLLIGTGSGGVVLYGDERRADITDQIVKGLNERYK